MYLVQYGNDAIFGKIDQVPGLFYVATRFFYIQFYPLVPQESYLVFYRTKKQSKTQKTTEGLAVETSLENGSLKSSMPPDRLVRLTGILDYHWGVPISYVRRSARFAWLRFACFASAVATLVIAIFLGVNAAISGSAAIGKAMPIVTGLAITSAVFWAILIATFRLTHATAGRALQLASEAGLPVELVRQRLIERGYDMNE